jgi:hypothetical protein
MKHSSECSKQLFDVEQDWRKLWRGMPEYDHEDLMPWHTIDVRVASAADRGKLADKLSQPLTENTRSVWHPRAEIGHYADRHYSSSVAHKPRYPIFIISKGRWESRLTAKALDAMKVAFRIVVEPQERQAYASVLGEERVLVLPFSNLGLGSIPARYAPRVRPARRDCADNPA